jgi:hypothetical protein
LFLSELCERHWYCETAIEIIDISGGLSKLQRMVDTLSSRYRKARDHPIRWQISFLFGCCFLNFKRAQLHDAISVRVHVLDVSSIERPCFNSSTTGKGDTTFFVWSILIPQDDDTWIETYIALRSNLSSPCRVFGQFGQLSHLLPQ